MLWENYFQSFFNWLNKYPNIAFIFSIRTPFEDIILPKDIIKKIILVLLCIKDLATKDMNQFALFVIFMGWNHQVFLS
ncbi:hypothetical protein BUY49_11750 [Staphylococcus devriesei]|nr:hypothetical protein BUY49_11750 [Staphylococcus devriesei]